MNKEQLMKKIEAAVDSAMRDRVFGSIEISFREGEPEMVRTMRTEKLNPQESYRGKGNSSR